MKHLEPYKSYLFQALLLLIIIPKFNLISVPGMSQGVRVDDILICCMFLVAGIQFNLRKQIWGIYFYISFITFVGLINNNNEYQFLRVISLARIMEYLVVYSVARYSMDFQSLIRFVKIVFWIEFITMAIQFVTGYSSGERASGTAAGPWEGALLICLSYLIWYHSDKKTIRTILLYSIALSAMLFMTAARAQLLAMAIILLVYVKKMGAPKLQKIAILVSAISIFIYFLTNIDFEYLNFNRSYYYVVDNYNEIIRAVLNENAVFDRNLANYDINIYDASLISRIGQWVYYLQSINDAYSRVFAVLFGSGPNSAGINLDGWYIKVFVDFGILGLLFYAFYLAKMVWSDQYRSVGILILVSGLTLDLFWASKFTYLFVIAWGVLNRNDA
jgi:hypothetical protein